MINFFDRIILRSSPKGLLGRKIHPDLVIAEYRMNGTVNFEEFFNGDSMWWQDWVKERAGMLVEIPEKLRYLNER